MKLLFALVSALNTSSTHAVNAADLPQDLKDKAVLKNSVNRPDLLITDNVLQRTHIVGDSLRGIDFVHKGGGSLGSGGQNGNCDKWGGNGGRIESWNKSCDQGGNGPLDIRLEIDCDVGHKKQSTKDVISMRLDNSDTPPKPVCGVPGGQCKKDWWGFGGDFYLPESGYKPFCVEDDDKIIVETDGTNAFIIDKLWISGDMDFSVGSNGKVGWCLSTDPTDEKGMGKTAYLGKCCRGLRIDLEAKTAEYWGC
eukprot:CAMPEP_0201604108 /NCGR_PEP_ID=MMETSP0492-20130828/4349_1 /ASSEMBLY_ACC=CAM_ASM_000837 /TAXON_ID=420259 /ORGANISM="Thalassiosira gravida, Strain GMp14c1" /LENGTH=251 /DNA_ID=CAMNT_0048068059 /DNA_START=71 /DNA_END=826 /DNA_ORIENTATION=+